MSDVLERPTRSETGRALGRIHRIRVDKELDAELDSKKDTVPSFRAAPLSLARGYGMNPNATYEDDFPTLRMMRPRRFTSAYLCWVAVGIVLAISAFAEGIEWLGIATVVMVVTNAAMYSKRL